jgi:hypothetical protein
VREREKGGAMIGFCWERGRRETVIVNTQNKKKIYR